MTLPVTETPAPSPLVGGAGTNLEPGPSNPLQEAGPSAGSASAGADVAWGEGEAPRLTSAPDLTTVEYAVRYTTPEAFAGTVAHIRHYRSTAEAMARSENDHPQHPDLRCHVVQRTVTYGPWTPTETEDT